MGKKGVARALAALVVVAGASLAVTSLVSAKGAQTLTFVDNENPGDGPCGIATAKVKRDVFLLTGSHFEDRITSYRVVKSTGELTPAGTATVAPGSRPVAVGFGWGRFAVAANQATADLYVFRMDRDGQFERVGDPVSTGGVSPVDMAVSSKGLIAVTNNGSDEVSFFRLRRDGGLTLLAVMPTGAQPAGVAISGNRIVVANTGSSSVSVFRLRRNDAVEIDNTTAIAAAPLELALSGRRVYVATAAPAQGQNGKLFYLKLGQDGGLREKSVLDCGRFPNGIATAGRIVVAATVNGSSQNEIRVYDRKLRPTTELALNGLPTSATLALGGSTRRTDVFLNEFNNSSVSSFRLER